MKTVLWATLLAFSLTMVAAMRAEASSQPVFTVESHITAGADPHFIQPFIRVSGDSANLSIGGRKIYYYFYESTLPVTWPQLPITTNGASTLILLLDKTYTGAAGKNANYVAEITLPSTATTPFEVSFSVAAGDNRTFTQSDDWSFMNTTNYMANSKIVFGDPGSLYAGSPPTNDPIRSNRLMLAKQKIKHVFVIMQENRSFDNYFGTFPNPPGINTVILNPDGTFFPGIDGVSNAPTVNRNAPAACGGTYNPAGTTLTATSSSVDPPHTMDASKTAFACPTPAAPSKTCSASGPLYARDFLQATYNYRVANSISPACSTTAFTDTVGHFDGSTATSPLYNHWTIAKNFLLQDMMFAPAPSNSRITHLFMVSGWSATCAAAPCSASQENYKDTTEPYAWKQVASALQSASVSWGAYRGDKFNYNCSQCASSPANCFGLADTFYFFWNPLQDFPAVKNIKGQNWAGDSLSDLFSKMPLVTDTDHSAVPKVSWIAPGLQVSEHPGGPDLKRGEAYVTTILKQIMANPALWNSSVVFLAWDDWGGYYDHVRPPKDSAGNLMYGIRVPAITISPWLGLGRMDHQTLSFDAYLKFIEDLFLNGQRLSGDGRPTPVRENQPALGDLLTQFDFHRSPMSPPPAVTALSCQAP
jgi:phospholipase C